MYYAGSISVCYAYPELFIYGLIDSKMLVKFCKLFKCGMLPIAADCA